MKKKKKSLDRKKHNKKKSDTALYDRRPMRGKIALIAAAVLLGVLVGAVTYIEKTYTIQNVYVEGNSHYTQEEIMERVMTGHLGHNSLFLNFKYHHMEVEDIPFVSAIEVNIVTPDTIRITVYEKSLAGYVSYLGRYMYFDKDGTIVESSEKATSGIPEVKGLSFDHVVMYDKLSVGNDAVFAEILDITQSLSKYNLHADKIYFEQNFNVTLYFGQVRVKIGNNENIDEKFSRLQAILPELTDKSGVLQMENYQSGSKTVTFQSDEPIRADVSDGNMPE